MGSATSQLKKWQKNLIVEAIQAVGLDPRQFDLEDGDAQVRIRHKWSPSCFTIRSDGAHYDVSCAVGDDTEWPVSAYSWQTIPARIRSWLEEVKRDLETPDLWAALQGEAQLLGAISDDVTENTPFSLDEQSEIAARLQALVKHVRHTYSPSTALMRALDAKVDYLVDAATRLGRKDWLAACVGTILAYMLAAALPPETVRGMFLEFARAIDPLFRLPDFPMLPF